jgi:hypothetical protein
MTSSHAYKEHDESKMPCRDGPQATLTLKREGWEVNAKRMYRLCTEKADCANEEAQGSALWPNHK